MSLKIIKLECIWYQLKLKTYSIKFKQLINCHHYSTKKQNNFLLIWYEISIKKLFCIIWFDLAIDSIN